MVEYLPRSAWGARAPKSGPGLLTVSRVIGAVIHWPGSSERDSFDSQAEVAAALRGWQAYHMDSRGWSDIAYQVAVDQAGRAWTLRGLRTQSGANGNNELNETYGAILLVLIAGEQPSAAMKATVRGVIADFREIYPNGKLIRPHSAVRPSGTDCPGPAARAAIARGDFTPGTTPPPSGGLTMADAASIEQMLKDEASRTLGRYQRAETVAAAQATLTRSVAAAVAALANQIKLEDAADDAALQALIKSVNDNVDALEAVIKTPPPEEPAAPLA